MGHFDICVHVFAPEFENDIEQLLQSLSLGLGFNMASQGNVHLVLVTPDAPEWFVESLGLPEWGKPICRGLYKIAKTISQDSYLDHLILKDLIRTVDFNPKDWFSPDQRMFVYHQGKQILCFAFVSEKEKTCEIVLNKISGYIFFLAIYWYASNNGLLLHGAAVVHNASGYLFLGQGGAGKSTAAALSASIGASILSDDLVFCINIGGGRYELAAAPGPASRFTMTPQLHPQLRGIFHLIQDTQDRLIPLSSIAIAHAIFRSFEWSQWVDHLSPLMVSTAFHTACDIARQVTGFELYFRKSPDFWKLIDGQFPD
jgi:hypothetical protein